jgi:hypothetical protein
MSKSSEEDESTTTGIDLNSGWVGRHARTIKLIHSRHFQVENDQDRERVSGTVHNDFTRKIIDSFLAVANRKQWQSA